MKKAIYPGSFDPLTNGHIDVALRALKVFDHIVIALLKNEEKSSIFSIDERISLIKETFKDNKNVSVESFNGLLIDYAKKRKINTVIRGLRAASDFEYEFQLAAMNRNLNEEVETIFLMTGNDTFFLSSRLIKEIASLGGDVSNLVPKNIFLALNKKYKGMGNDR